MPTKRVKQFTSWSFSRLKDYDDCALRAKLKHLDRLKEPEGPALLNGSRVHKLAESYILARVPEVEARLDPFRKDFEAAAKGKMPTELETFAEELNELRANNMVVQVEVDAAFTKDWEPTRWDDWDGCWLRGKIDVLWVEMGGAEVRDWKTGKVNPENVLQLDLYALAVFCLYPQVGLVDAKLCYTDVGEEVVRTYSRDLDYKRLKKAWTAKPKKMLADTKFSPSPGSHCRYCWFSQASIAKGGSGQCKF